MVWDSINKRRDRRKQRSSAGSDVVSLQPSTTECIFLKDISPIRKGKKPSKTTKTSATATATATAPTAASLTASDGRDDNKSAPRWSTKSLHRDSSTKTGKKTDSKTTDGRKSTLQQDQPSQTTARRTDAVTVTTSEQPNTIELLPPKSSDAAPEGFIWQLVPTRTTETDIYGRINTPDNLERTAVQVTAETRHGSATDGFTDGRKSSRTDSSKTTTTVRSPSSSSRHHGQHDLSSDYRTDSRMDGRMDSRTDGRMVGRTDGRDLPTTARSPSHHGRRYGRHSSRRHGDRASREDTPDSRERHYGRSYHRSAGRNRSRSRTPIRAPSRHRDSRSSRTSTSITDGSKSPTPTRQRRQSPSPVPHRRRTVSEREVSPSMSPAVLQEMIRTYQRRLEELSRLHEHSATAIRASEATDPEMVAAVNEIYSWLPEDVCPAPTDSTSSRSNSKPRSRADQDVTLDNFRPLPSGSQIRENMKVVMDTRKKADNYMVPASRCVGRFNARVYTPHDNFLTVKAPVLDDCAETLDLKEPKTYPWTQKQMTDTSTMLRKTMCALNFLDLAEAALEEAVKSQEQLSDRESILRLMKSIFRSTNDVMGHVVSVSSNVDTIRRTHIMKHSDQIQDFRKKELQRLPLNTDYVFADDIKRIRPDVFAENSNRAVLSSIKRTGRSPSRRQPSPRRRSFSRRGRSYSRKRNASSRRPSSSTTKRVRFDSTSRPSTSLASSRPTQDQGQRFSGSRPRKPSF